ncbi:MAG: hypothetical protein NT121_25455 [Chloroflexi bacterium]|nr:hypothetical protein [Chloroflexota bacterium]
MEHTQRARREKENRSVIKLEHRNIWGAAAEYVTRLKTNGLSGNINTSFVERVKVSTSST